MPRFKMISAVSAITEAPDLWEQRLTQDFRDQCPRMIETKDGIAWSVNGETGAPCAGMEAASARQTNNGKGAAISDLQWLSTADGRRWIQKRDDMDGEVLYALSDVWRLINKSEDQRFKLACYKAYNDWLAELTAQDPDAFIGLAKIPTTGAQDAADELQRSVGELKLRGAILDCWPGGPESSAADEEADIFWDAANELGAPLSIHQSLSGEKTKKPLVAAGGPPGYASDLNALVYANIFDRFPKLRVVSASPSVGWAPSQFEGVDETYMRTAGSRTMKLGDPDLLPSDYLRRFFWFAVQDDRFAILNRKYFGDAHVMWASFALTDVDSAWPNTRQLFERLTGGMPDTDRQALASQVVSRLYGIGSIKPFKPTEITEYERYALL